MISDLWFQIDQLSNCPTAAWRLLTANYQFGFVICDLKFEIFDWLLPVDCWFRISDLWFEFIDCRLLYPVGSLLLKMQPQLFCCFFGWLVMLFAFVNRAAFGWFDSELYFNLNLVAAHGKGRNEIIAQFDVLFQWHFTGYRNSIESLRWWNGFTAFSKYCWIIWLFNNMWKRLTCLP